MIIVLMLLAAYYGLLISVFESKHESDNIAILWLTVLPPIYRYVPPSSLLAYKKHWRRTCAANLSLSIHPPVSAYLWAITLSVIFSLPYQRHLNVSKTFIQSEL